MVAHLQMCDIQGGRDTDGGISLLVVLGWVPTLLRAGGQEQEGA